MPFAQLGTEGTPHEPPAHPPSNEGVDSTDANAENNFLLFSEPQDGHSIFSWLLNDLW